MTRAGTAATTHSKCSRSPAGAATPNHALTLKPSIPASASVGTSGRAVLRCAVVKRLWGFTKVRYRGLQKNATRAFTALALANIYLCRSHLLGQVRP